jgi:iron-sulfur cluster assembly accessory protein
MQSAHSTVRRTSSAESRKTPRRHALTTTQIIEVTDLAAEKLEEVLNEQGEDGALLRVMVMPGEQGGFQYMLGVEKDAKDDDIMIDAGNIRVLVDPESAPMVEGAKIDYIDSLMRSGFVISNPNLQGEGGGGCGGGGGGCGCGGGGGGGCGSGGGGGGGCGSGGGGGGGCACGGH